MLTEERPSRPRRRGSGGGPLDADGDPAEKIGRVGVPAERPALADRQEPARPRSGQAVLAEERLPPREAGAADYARGECDLAAVPERPGAVTSPGRAPKRAGRQEDEPVARGRGPANLQVERARVEGESGIDQPRRPRSLRTVGVETTFALMLGGMRERSSPSPSERERPSQ